MAGLLLAGTGFFLYILLSPASPPVQTASSESEFTAPVIPSGRGGKVGGTTIDLVENSQWIRRDPQSKKVIEAGGFSKLLTPPEGSAYWMVETPYLIRYEDRLTCRIDAQRGRIQMDQSGDLPSNVELMDHVILQIHQAGHSNPEDLTHIYLDNLIYSSERSEFSTDGPVRMVSLRAELKGRGLILIYNPQAGQMEYLEVRDLDSLLIKGGGSFWKKSNPSDSRTQTEKAKNASAELEGPPLVRPPKMEKTVLPQDKPEGIFYQCSIQNNVVIQYGRRLVVAGADQVNIQQILWAGGSSGSSDSSSQTEAAAKHTPASSQEAAKVSNRSAAQPNVQNEQPLSPADSPIGTDDILITCDGGIIIQPMEQPFPPVGKEKSLPSVEMIGQLQIERFQDEYSPNAIPLASCSSLRYLLQEDILELFTDSPRNPILIYLDQAGSMIRTQGHVLWDRKANLAHVNGPGRINFAGDPDPVRVEDKELIFQGLMDLEFADRPEIEEDSSLSLKTVNLTGGMEAFLQNEGIRGRANQARFTFQPSNKPDTLDLQGDVHFETDSKGQKSQVQAQNTVFYFDSAGQIQTANLAGQVRLTSSGQTAEADTADIQFQQNQDGRLTPGHVRLGGKSHIESPGGKDMPPARFEALQIDYDLQTGKAIAAGPIHFTFYTPAEGVGNLLSGPIPVDITAHDRAEFLSDGKGTIEQVTFFGKVAAQWKAEGSDQQQIRRFFGDRLIVDLDKDTADGQRIQHVSIQDQQVLFESIHLLEGKKVNHIRLTCRQFDYTAAENRLTALGPGKLELNNQQVPAVLQTSDPISLQKPCFAYMEGFDQLVWNLDSGTVLAEGKNGIYLNYWPFEQGVLGDQVIVQCVRSLARFASGAQGKNELVLLQTGGGVEYREQKERGRYLQGDMLSYERTGQWILIEGTDAHPCKVDGVSVPMIQYNPQTGEIKTKLSTSPASLPISPQIRVN